MAKPTYVSGTLGADGRTITITVSESSNVGTGAVTAKVTAKGFSATLNVPAGAATVFACTLNWGLIYPTDTVVVDWAAGAFVSVADSQTSNVASDQTVTNSSKAIAGVVILPSAFKYLNAKARRGA